MNENTFFFLFLEKHEFIMEQSGFRNQHTRPARVCVCRPLGEVSDFNSLENERHATPKKTTKTNGISKSVRLHGKNFFKKGPT